MTNITSQGRAAAVQKRNWLRKNYLSLLILFLVIAIVVGLLLFSHRYPEKIEEFENYGYLGAFLVSLVTNATVILPMPGFLLFFALGATFNPVLVGLAGGIGAAIGEMTCYLLGYSGRGVVENRRFYDQSAQWLKKWGSLTVFVFALTPLPFDVLGIAAGLLRFPFWKFFLACWLGKTLLLIGMAFAGAWGWEAFVTGTLLSSTLSITVFAVLGVLLLLALALAIGRWTWKRG